MAHSPYIQPLSVAQLKSLSTPRTGGGLEAIRDVVFDVQTYKSGTTAQLTFFLTAQNNAQLSNLTGSGQLPANNYFVIRKVHILPIIAPSFKSGATDATGAVNDMFNLMIGGLPTLTVTLNNKPVIAGIPAAAAQGLGGVTGAISATLTAPADIQFANNGMPGAGFEVGQWIIIQPNTPFQAQITWNAAQTLQGDTKILVAFSGDRYRPVS